MKIVFLFGDAAVGKMTVGQKLCEITPFRLFHNHMTIEPVLEIFGEFHKNTIERMREVVFEEFAKSDNYGLITTFMFDFDSNADWEFLEKIANIFKKQDAQIYYVELVAPLEIYSSSLPIFYSIISAMATSSLSLSTVGAIAP